MSQQNKHVSQKDKLPGPVQLTPAQLGEVSGGYGPVLPSGDRPQGNHTELWAK